jgi:hypothetical protein
MSSTHIVLPGETLSSIAQANNFANFLTIWNDAGNAKLRTLRHNPHILAEGDAVFIPDLPDNVAHGDDAQRHVFSLQEPALFLNMQLQDFDGKPLDDEDCVLRVDAKDKNGREALEDTFELTTDAAGKFSQEILDDADDAELKVGDEDFYVIVIGGLDPVRIDSGVQQRLNNLGYFAGFSDADQEQLRWAIEEFQNDHGISPVKGDKDSPSNVPVMDRTKKTLGEIHGDRDLP